MSGDVTARFPIPFNISNRLNTVYRRLPLSEVPNIGKLLDPSAEYISEPTSADDGWQGGLVYHVGEADVIILFPTIYDSLYERAVEVRSTKEVDPELVVGLLARLAAEFERARLSASR